MKNSPNQNKAIEIFKNTVGVISAEQTGIYDERFVAKLETEYVLSKISENLTDAGIYGKNQALSFNYGYDDKGVYLAVYDVVYL